MFGKRLLRKTFDMEISLKNLLLARVRIIANRFFGLKYYRLTMFQYII